MKRTADLIVRKEGSQYNEWESAGYKITCEVVGEMEDGTKVWQDVETGEQYFLTRLYGHYEFFKG